MNTNKDSSVKSIGDLKAYEFVVDDYQRGYKWTDEEVKQLLNDIDGFEGKGFYCLQPIVVKSMAKKGPDIFELIDGQQRLTTLFIILSVISSNHQEKYTISYKTRSRSEEFIRDINSLDTDQSWDQYLTTNKNNDNIDNYHFFEATKAIKLWVKKQPKSDLTHFIAKILRDVKVIWYEVPSFAQNDDERKKESVKIFTRINGGKIPLTNAELIKALFMINISNGANKELLTLKQNEIAQQWDAIEYFLQNDSFWYFLSNREPPPTRIELLFDLISKKGDDEKDRLYTFLTYNKRFNITKDRNAWVVEEWDKVKDHFETLKEWYQNRRLFHFIGYLVWLGDMKLIEILEWKKMNMSKADFLRKVEEAAKIDLGSTKTLAKIGYEERKIIRAILVLHNILTLLKNETSTDFSFEKFKNENWDIEHIHARESKDINDAKNWREWKRETEKALQHIVLDEENEQRRNDLLVTFKEMTEEQLNKQSFDRLFLKVIAFYDSLDDNRSEINALSNLALLDAGTNRSYKNAIFSVKRNKIIDQDKKGVFIPICTKNVFLKYYSNDATQMFIWKYEDRQKYFEDIVTYINPYLKTS